MQRECLHSSEPAMMNRKLQNPDQLHNQDLWSGDNSPSVIFRKMSTMKPLLLYVKSKSLI